MRLFRPVQFPRLLPLLLPAALIALGPCGCTGHEPPRRAFYYWKTRVELTPPQVKLLERLQVDRLFIRFFDVGWDAAAGQAVPVAPCQFDGPLAPTAETVPVIFFKNQVFQNLPPDRVSELARQVWQKTGRMADANTLTFRELQLDCDWTENTRSGFFSLAGHLRRDCAAAGVALSATVRLHQVKYPDRTGLPPVDRVTLMFYNMGRIQSGDGPMSIYNSEDARRYTASIAAYPLPLDLALPAFGWTIHSRAGRVLELLTEVGDTDLHGNKDFRPLSPDRYMALRSFFFRGVYVMAGDEFRVESVRPELALEAARLAASAMGPPKGRLTVALFDLNERNLGLYGPEEYEKIYRCFD